MSSSTTALSDSDRPERADGDNYQLLSERSRPPPQSQRVNINSSSSSSSNNNKITDRNSRFSKSKASGQTNSSLTPAATYKSPLTLRNTMNRLKAFLTPTPSNTNLLTSNPDPLTGFSTAKLPTALFQQTDPQIDGEECLHDCDSCTVSLPRKWEIEEKDDLYGHVKGWDYHLIVATGKSDWVRDVEDEKGSLMEALGEKGLDVISSYSAEQTTAAAPTNDSIGGDVDLRTEKKQKGQKRNVKLSACDMPTGDLHDDETDAKGKSLYKDNGRTRCVVLPSWTLIEGVTRKDVNWLMDDVVGGSADNTSPLKRKLDIQDVENGVNSSRDEHNPRQSSTTTATTKTSTDELSLQTTRQTEFFTPRSTMPALDQTDESTSQPQLNDLSAALTQQTLAASSIPPGIKVLPLPHRALILLCSHKTRDARCGQSAPLLRKEFERHLRARGMYRDYQDTRPGGVGVYFINHVGGHKYSANVMIYRRQMTSSSSASSFSTSDNNSGEVTEDEELNDEAVQGIWLARVRPEDCENIVRYTVLQGKLVKPQRQLRGGFDRSCGLTSW